MEIRTRRVAEIGVGCPAGERGKVSVFRAACDIAKDFTFPVVISSRAVDGKIKGGIGTFIVLNDEGWIATCRHIAEQVEQKI
jgi:biotin carboxylase